uniref:GDNF domain-containing protein n=1 Tax=Steinernema glaseri TaxID=37863 RepID=A0A1I7ZRZ5_9BILA
MIAAARATNHLSSLLLSVLLLFLLASAPNAEASPVRSSRSVSHAIPKNIDSLRRSIEMLRQSMGAQMFQNFKYDFADTLESPDSLANEVSSSPAAILNVRADLRPMDAADSEPDTDRPSSSSDERPQMDAPSGQAHSQYFVQHPHRHSAGGRKHRPHHRLRRKGCPASKSGHRQMLCPSRNAHSYDVCISVEQLCDKVADCPQGEDEDPTTCLFYKTTREQLKQIYNTVLLLADHAVGQQQHFEL